MFLCCNLCQLWIYKLTPILKWRHVLSPNYRLVGSVVYREMSVYRCMLLFIFSQFDWICCDGTEGVCMCVCVSVCVCVCVCVCVLQRYSPNGWMDFDEIFYKWSDRYLWGPFFADFEMSKSMMSWRPFLHFFAGALSQSQFCSDFLQNCRGGRKLSFAVCYSKSARSVGNSRQKYNM